MDVISARIQHLGHFPADHYAPVNCEKRDESLTGTAECAARSAREMKVAKQSQFAPIARPRGDGCVVHHQPSLGAVETLRR
jgi:hypothetical protein